MSADGDLVLAPVPTLAPLGARRPVLAYPIAGRPLYQHLLERAAARVDGTLSIAVADPWFQERDSVLQELARFGSVEMADAAGRTTSPFPLRDGTEQPLEFLWQLLDIVADVLAAQTPGLSSTADVEGDVEISGNVRIEAGARVLGGSRIKGNVYIGPGAFVGNGALVRGNTHIGADAMLGFACEVKSSVLLERAIVGPSSAVPDCVQEEDSFLGGLVRISNTQLGFRNVSVMPQGRKIDSGRQFLGAAIGAGAKLAGGVRVSPGRGIGHDCEIGPGVLVSRNVAPNSRVQLVQELAVEDLPAPARPAERDP